MRAGATGSAETRTALTYMGALHLAAWFFWLAFTALAPLVYEILARWFAASR